jgi:tetratricopeptide (TPR) repeat protein
MLKKTHFVFIIVCNLLFYMTIGNCFADTESQFSQADILRLEGKTSEAMTAYKELAGKLLQDTSEINLEYIRQIADRYRGMGKHKEACVLYKQFLEHTALSEDELVRTKVGLIRSQIGMGEGSEVVQPQIDELLKNTSEIYLEAVRQIADRYRWMGDYKEASVLYEHFLKQSSLSGDGLLKVKVGLIRSQIGTGEGVEIVQPQIDELFVNTSEIYLEAIRQIADQYWWRRSNKEACVLYKHFLKYSSLSGDELVGIKSNLIRSQINMDEEPEAVQPLIGELLKNTSEIYLEAIRQIADQCRGKGKYEEAYVLYEHFLKHTSSSGDKLVKAQGGMVVSRIGTGEWSGSIQPQIDELLVNTSEVHLEVIHQIADQCRWKGDYKEACVLYKHFLKYSSLSGDELVRMKTNLIRSQIGMGERSAVVQPQIDELLANTSEVYLEAIRQISDQYRWRPNHSKANVLYEHYLKHSSSKDKALIWSETSKIASDIDPEESLDAVLPQIEELLKDHTGHSDLPQAVFIIGEEYYLKAEEAAKAKNRELAKACYQKAVAVWDININRLAGDWQSYYYSAFACQRASDNEKSGYYFQQAVAKWPKHKDAWNAQFMIASCADRQARENPEQKPELAKTILKACDDLLRNYPDSPAAAAARTLRESYSMFPTDEPTDIFEGNG